MQTNRNEISKKYIGLTNEEVITSREKYGENRISEKKEQPLIIKILTLIYQ